MAASASASTPPVRTRAALSRTSVLDSGSVHHAQTKSDLTPDETDCIPPLREHRLAAASGDREVDEHMQLKITDIGLSSSALAMTRCPSVISR
eukprot:7731041-Pyramimonas_sp.AAC.1